MKIVILDAYTENPGDLSWERLQSLGELIIYDRTPYTDTALIAERIGDADIVIVNLPKFCAYLIGVGLRRVALFCGSLLDLLPVLVGAGHKVRIIAL